MPKPITPQVEIFTRTEAQEMLSCLEDEPLQYKVLIYLALMSGAREGELVAHRLQKFVVGVKRGGVICH